MRSSDSHNFSRILLFELQYFVATINEVKLFVNCNTIIDKAQFDVSINSKMI